MAVTAPVLVAAIKAASPELNGPDWLRMTAAVSVGIVAWLKLPANLTMTGATSGGAGAGTVNGKFAMVADVLLLTGALTTAGLVGPNAVSIAKAVGIGLFTAFNSQGAYVGASSGVGSGTDASKVTVSNPATLAAAIQTAAIAQGLGGPDMVRLSAALGAGLAAMFLTGTGVGTVAGAGGPLPAAGTSISLVV